MKNPDRTFNHRQLYLLLDKIVAEERSFKRNCCGTHVGGARAGGPNSGEKSNRAIPVRKALADRHREYLSEHELVLQRCFAVSRQTRAGLLSEEEAALEVERLQRDLRKLRAEHSVIKRESERRAEKHF